MFQLVSYLPEYKPLMDEVVCKAGFSDAIYIFPGWAATSLMALVASAMVLAFIYMLASMFQNQEALAKARMELYEFAVTCAIFTVLYMLLGGMCSVKTGWFFPEAGHNTALAGGGIGGFESWADKSPYYSSSNYLMDFADYTLNVMTAQYAGYVFIDFVTGMEIYSVPMGVGATMKPTSGLGAAVKPVLNNAFTAETISVITTEAQAYIMDYGTYGMLKYFLPIGLVMRSFLPTRRIGGTLIAITCTFLFIYPWLVIPAYYIVNDSLLSTLDYFGNAVGAGVFNAVTIFKALLEFLFKWMWGPDFLMSYALMTMPMVAKVFIGGVFFPLFNTVILVSAAYQLSKTLGEEIDITNLTRMI